MKAEGTSASRAAALERRVWGNKIHLEAASIYARREGKKEYEVFILLEQVMMPFREKLIAAGIDIDKFGERKGVDGMSIKNIGYRFVRADSPETRDAIIREAEQNGGEPSHRTLVGLCIDSGSSYIQKRFLRSSTNEQCGVIFLYDLRKLTALTPQEEKKSNQFVAGHGLKPLENETYRSALVGCIRVGPDCL